MTRRALAAAVLLAAAPLARAGEVELAYGEDVLSRDRGDWRLLSLEAALAPAEHAAVQLTARALERFGLRDVEAGAGVTLPGPWSPRTAFTAEATASTTHRLVPAWSGALRVEQPLPLGFVASAGFRWSDYGGDPAAGAGARTAVVTTGLERYFGRYRVAATAFLSGVSGAWSASGRLALDVFGGDRDRVGVAVAAGRELESTGPGVLLASDVLAATLTGRHAVGDDWAVTWELGVQRQGELYTRAGARLGLRRRF